LQSLENMGPEHYMASAEANHDEADHDQSEADHDQSGAENDQSEDEEASVDNHTTSKNEQSGIKEFFAINLKNQTMPRKKRFEQYIEATNSNLRIEQVKRVVQIEIEKLKKKQS
jgi:hypothetical protein